MDDSHQSLRVPVAARRLGLTTRNLYLRIDAGELRAHRDNRGMVVIDEADLADIPGLPGT